MSLRARGAVSLPSDDAPFRVFCLPSSVVSSGGTLFVSVLAATALYAYVLLVVVRCRNALLFCHFFGSWPVIALGLASGPLRSRSAVCVRCWRVVSHPRASRRRDWSRSRCAYARASSRRRRIRLGLSRFHSSRCPERTSWKLSQSDVSGQGCWRTGAFRGRAVSMQMRVVV